MDDSTPGLAVLGETTRGIWTRRQALTVVSRGVVQSHVRRGLWQVVWPGVYADAGQVLDAGQRAHAAVQASGGGGRPFLAPDGRRSPAAVASGRTAARLHRLPLIDDHDVTTGAMEHLLDDVNVARRADPLEVRWPDGQVRVLTRTTAALRREDVVRTASGLWLTSVLRTLVDCAGLLTFEALVCALDHALHHHQVTGQALADAVADRAGCSDVVALRRAVRCADRRAESPAETLARLALLPTLPSFVPQHRLLAGDGRVLARYDLADVELRLAVEADGKAAHAGAHMVAKDRRRDRISEQHGWRTERVTWWELRRQREAFVERVTAVAEQRRDEMART